ncbi:MAG TPA: phosphatase PAP2 family protein, partial [Gemmatimonadaceae bacterium]|nr:phosphatase PAP2 family protein [Gemmatimonadaceae bacterium]
ANPAGMKIQNSGRLLGANLASTAALAGLGSLVLRGSTRRFDNRVREYFPRYRRSRTKHTTETLGPIGKTWLQLTVTGGVAAYLLVRGKGLDSAGAVVLSSVAAYGASAAAEKFLPRRHAPWGRLSVTEPSFPSGHALRAATVTLVTAYVLIRENVGHRKVAVPIALAIPPLTALHALYLDRHWATDLVGGWLGGVAIATACAYGYEVAQAGKTDRRKRKRLS